MARRPHIPSLERRGSGVLRRAWVNALASNRRDRVGRYRVARALCRPRRISTNRPVRRGRRRRRTVHQGIDVLHPVLWSGAANYFSAHVLGQREQVVVCRELWRWFGHICNYIRAWPPRRQTLRRCCRSAASEKLSNSAACTGSRANVAREERSCLVLQQSRAHAVYAVFRAGELYACACCVAVCLQELRELQAYARGLVLACQAQ
jgi:hypothetical protein